MKKILIGLLLMVSMSAQAQRDSSKMLFSNGTALDTSLVYVSVSLQVFSTGKTTEMYWVGSWDKTPATATPKNYGMDMKKIWVDMIDMAKKYSLKNHKGEVIDIGNEDNLFNLMAANGYRFLTKTPLPPMNVGIVAARAFAGNVYKFEKR